MKKIYISGPITKGNRSHNLYQSLEAQRRLLLAGYAPLNPMLTMLHPSERDIPWATWLAADLPWVEVSDLIIRLPGDSDGADLECKHAAEHGKEIITWREFQEQVEV